jgi:hypothetical protein
MGGLRYAEISFPNGLPNPEQMWVKLRQRTGLHIELDLSDEGDWCVFSSSEFILPCELNRADGDTKIHVVLPRFSYLEWCVIAILIDLGGIFDGEVPEFVNVKWENRKWWWYFTLR